MPKYAKVNIKLKKPIHPGDPAKHSYLRPSMMHMSNDIAHSQAFHHCIQEGNRDKYTS